MCMTCGCSDTETITLTDPATGKTITLSKAEHDRAHALGIAHDHSHAHIREHSQGRGHTHDRDAFRGHGHDHPDDHAHDHVHEHAHGPVPAGAAIGGQAKGHTRTMALEEEVLAKNRLLAERNRGWLAGRGVVALNLMSSPGAGKTTLLERTIRDLKEELQIHVIEGDQATINDAERIRATGCKVIQINTGTGCHLDAEMLARGLRELDPPFGSVVMIENVGNLVCPALFDLGEQAKVVILSVTEGEDKPIKYPHMFKASELMVINKIDLLPYLQFDIERCIAFAREVNPAIRVLRVSAQTGEGMDAWYGWLRSQRHERPHAGVA
ncbi:hydrogenase nickel incorporation protein HypB [Pelomicrobium sp. G1]|uniref:hydrogenase nickel incorporation protein HypB n=1 Tax=unclassified Pelomicrobium TaxID=2815318 RepID=UPI003F7611BC